MLNGPREKIPLYSLDICIDIEKIFIHFCNMYSYLPVKSYNFQKEKT